MVTPSAARFLVVNADDLGLSPAVNDGVRHAHERGIVTSASLMVRAPEAAAAASYAQRAPGLSVGLHLDLGEWVYRQGTWVERYAVVDIGDAEAVAVEVAHQLDRFRRLVGRDPSHLDSHQHVHRHEPVRSLLLAVAAELGLPVRDLSGVGYQGGFYGQDGHGEPYPEGITVEALLALLDDLPEGWTELGCHPASGPVDDAYGPERVQELEALCDPRLREQLEARGIRLCTFDDARQWLDITSDRSESGLPSGSPPT